MRERKDSEKRATSWALRSEVLLNLADFKSQQKEEDVKKDVENILAEQMLRIFY